MNNILIDAPKHSLDEIKQKRSLCCGKCCIRTSKCCIKSFSAKTLIGTKCTFFCYANLRLDFGVFFARALRYHAEDEKFENFTLISFHNPLSWKMKVFFLKDICISF